MIEECLSSPISVFILQQRHSSPIRGKMQVPGTGDGRGQRDIVLTSENLQPSGVMAVKKDTDINECHEKPKGRNRVL